MAKRKIEFFDSALGKAVKAGGYAFISALSVSVAAFLSTKGIQLEDSVITSLIVGLANALIYGTVKLADKETPNLPTK